MPKQRWPCFITKAVIWIDSSFPQRNRCCFDFADVLPDRRDDGGAGVGPGERERGADEEGAFAEEEGARGDAVEPPLLELAELEAGVSPCSRSMASKRRASCAARLWARDDIVRSFLC